MKIILGYMIKLKNVSSILFEQILSRYPKTTFYGRRTTNYSYLLLKNFKHNYYFISNVVIIYDFDFNNI